MLKSLQAGRGIAAILVVLYHLNGSVFGTASYDPHQMLSLFEAGRSGVDFFFVLSGFIIYYVHRDDIGRPAALRNYAFKRFVRIYPIYWIVLFAIIPVYFLRPSFGVGNETQALQIITSATLWPTPTTPILAVAWTLRHEMLFYLLYATLLVDLRLGVAVIGGWFVGCLVSLFIGASQFPVSFLFAEINLLFLLGIAAAWTFSRLRMTAPIASASLITGLAVYALSAARLIDDEAAPLAHLGFGVGSALGIVGAVNLERLGKLTVPRALEFLGNASYSIYLTHFLVLSLTAKVVFGTGLAAHVHRSITFSLLLIVAIGVGCLFYLFVERRVISFTKRRPRVSRTGELMTQSL